jgi:toxin ParE1/3/4
MSARKLRLDLSPRAQHDLRGIWLYGFERRGEEQADSYVAALLQGLERLRDNPGLGFARDDLREGWRGLLIDQHRALCVI